MFYLGTEPLEDKFGSLCKVEEWRARLHFGCKECMLCVVLGSCRCNEKASEFCDLEAVEREKETNKTFPLLAKYGHDIQAHNMCVVGLTR